MIKEQIAFLEEHKPDSPEIEKLKKKLTKSKRGRGSRNKGSTYERTVQKMIKDILGIELERTPLSGGFAKKSNLDAVKGDLNTLDNDIDFLFHIECKNQKTWGIKGWWRQTIDDCPKGKVPIIVMHQNQENKDGKRVQEADDFVFIRATDFFEIVDKEKVVKIKK